MCIQRRAPVFGAHAAGIGHIGMKALRMCVHPGIRASACRDAQRLAQNPHYGFLYCILHRGAAALALPAAIRQAIIRTCKQETGHNFQKTNAAVLFFRELRRASSKRDNQGERVFN
jgi:hypothetical protein